MKLIKPIESTVWHELPRYSGSWCPEFQVRQLEQEHRDVLGDMIKISKLFDVADAEIVKNQHMTKKFLHKLLLDISEIIVNNEQLKKGE